MFSSMTSGLANSTSDFDGKFSIKVSKSNAVLVISYVGFETQEINVAGKSSINISLKPNLESLDEIVVIGYGTSRKSDLTGSVVSVSGDDLKKQSISFDLCSSLIEHRYDQ